MVNKMVQLNCSMDQLQFFVITSTKIFINCSPECESMNWLYIYRVIHNIQLVAISSENLSRIGGVLSLTKKEDC